MPTNTRPDLEQSENGEDRALATEVASSRPHLPELQQSVRDDGIEVLWERAKAELTPGSPILDFLEELNIGVLRLLWILGAIQESDKEEVAEITQRRPPPLDRSQDIFQQIEGLPPESAVRPLLRSLTELHAQLASEIVGIGLPDQVRETNAQLIGLAFKPANMNATADWRISVEVNRARGKAALTVHQGGRASGKRTEGEPAIFNLDESVRQSPAGPVQAEREKLAGSPGLSDTHEHGAQSSSRSPREPMQSPLTPMHPVILDPEFEAFISKRWPDPVLQDLARVIYYEGHRAKYSTAHLSAEVFSEVLDVASDMRVAKEEKEKSKGS